MPEPTAAPLVSGFGPVSGIAPAAAEAVFGTRLALARRYAELLATDGVVRGLIGPREADRVWERHLINCAVLGELIPQGDLVVDVGSGAGLPGIPLALARPDLRIDLVEPMERRASFLRDVIAELELTGVSVLRARGEEVQRSAYDVVTARAVAPLVRLVPMALVLARPGGTLLAMKGRGAAAELVAARSAIAGAGGADAEVLEVGTGLASDVPTTVVRVRRGATPAAGKARRG